MLRRFARRIAYRNEVQMTLGALLLIYPRGRQFADDFPALPAAIRAHGDAGTAPALAALDLAGTIAATLASSLATEARHAVADALRDTADATFAALAERRLAGEAIATTDATAFARDLIGVARLMARRMASDGTLRAEDVAQFEVRIAAALEQRRKIISWVPPSPRHPRA